MADIRFHDISYAQGLYDMDADKCPIIFMKMSGFYYGSKTPYYDDQAARNYQNAVRTNKFKGLYHFAGGADPVTEADFFVGACSPLADGDLLILDYELTAEMNPPADPSAWCLAFVERVKERTGKYPLFYTYFAMLQQHGFTEVLKKCGLWIAHYGIAPEQDIPNCPPYIIHQYQGHPLDTNACYVGIDVLQKYAYQSNQPQPAPVDPVPTPEPQPVPSTGTNIDGVIPPVTQPEPELPPVTVPETEPLPEVPNKENNVKEISFGPNSKAIVAIIGAVLTWAVTNFPNNPTVQTVAGLLSAILTAAGVWKVSNEPETK